MSSPRPGERDQPARAQAEELGHTVYWDPPPRQGKHADARWTCLACGQAALRRGSRIYGGALGDPCPGQEMTG